MGYKHYSTQLNILEIAIEVSYWIRRMVRESFDIYAMREAHTMQHKKVSSKDPCQT
jgi:hypothetical protein